MRLRYPELPSWHFDIEEVSGGVYEASAVHERGPRVQMKGTDPDALLADARNAARELDQQIG
jgi:hypothetical protein